MACCFGGPFSVAAGKFLVYTRHRFIWRCRVARISTDAHACGHTWTKPAVNRIGKRTGPARILISQILPPWAEKWFPLLSMHAQKITAAAETLIHRAGREPQRQIQSLKRLEIREKISNLGKEFFNIFEDQLLEFGNRLWYHNLKLLDHGVTMSFF